MRKLPRKYRDIFRDETHPKRDRQTKEASYIFCNDTFFSRYSVAALANPPIPGSCFLNIIIHKRTEKKYETNEILIFTIYVHILYCCLVAASKKVWVFTVEKMADEDKLFIVRNNFFRLSKGPGRQTLKSSNGVLIQKNCEPHSSSI